MGKIIQEKMADIKLSNKTERHLHPIMGTTRLRGRKKFVMHLILEIPYLTLQ